MSTYISGIIPVFNEERNIAQLISELEKVLDGLDYELLLIDDGSEDGSWQQLKKAHEKNSRVKVIRLISNYGQHAAFAAGFQLARGQLIFTMDSDLQNDPTYLPEYIEQIEKHGADAAYGWRENRENSVFYRQLPSRLFNAWRNLFIKTPLHDYGCSLNLFKRKFIDEVKDRPDMLKHLPTYIATRNVNIKEVRVSERERVSGNSNYNYLRLLQLAIEISIASAPHPVATSALLIFSATSCLLMVFAMIFNLSSLLFGNMGLLDYIIYPYLFLMGGIITAALALVNERLSGMLRFNNKKPLYIIKERLE